MNKATKIPIIAIVVLIIFAVTMFYLRGEEDTWVKDSRGVWIEHGKPSTKPAEAVKQEEVISRAKEIFLMIKKEDEESLVVGPCLGQIEPDWVLDVVHNPRTTADDLSENQCLDYTNSTAKHLVELDLDGNVVRVN
jgi:hypothetical protein